MTASYPGGIRTWTTKLDFRNIFWAAYMNDMQAEIDATQRTMGINPHISRNNPGGLTRIYPTLEQRMTAQARGEDLPYFRGQVTELVPSHGAWVDVPMTGAAIKSDPFHMGEAGGVRLNTHAVWMLQARTEWQASGYTLINKARRQLRILVNGADVGLGDFTGEDARNSFAIHNQVVWPEALPRGTQITVQVRTDLEPDPAPDPPDDPDDGQVWCHQSAPLRLLRCWNGSSWAHYTGSQTTGIDSATPPVPFLGRLWIDTSGPVRLPKVYTAGAWQPFTGLEETLTTLADAPTAPSGHSIGDVWVDTAATADVVQAFSGGSWKKLAGRNCRDGGGAPVPQPPPTTPTDPTYGLKVNVDLRLYLVRCLDDVQPLGMISHPADLV